MGIGLITRDQYIIKLKWDFIKAKGAVEQAYALGFNQALG